MKDVEEMTQDELKRYAQTLIDTIVVLKSERREFEEMESEFKDKLRRAEIEADYAEKHGKPCDEDVLHEIEWCKKSIDEIHPTVYRYEHILDTLHEVGKANGL